MTGLLMFLAAAGSVRAGNPPAPLDLGWVLQQVREHNADVLAARLDVDQARATVRGSRTWPDPVVGVEYWGVPRPGLDLGAADQRLLDVSQAIPFPTKTIAAGQVARHDLARREAAAERVLQDQLLAATQAYWDLWVATATTAALGTVGTTLDDLARLSDRRIQLGQVGRMEQLMTPMAKMARLELDNDLLMLTQDRTMAQATLNRLMGREPGTPMPDPTEPPAAPGMGSDDEVLHRAVAQRAELVEARHHVLHTRAQRTLAVAGWIPDVMVQYSTVDTRQGAPMSMVMAKVNVPFAWFWRQGAEVAAASRMVDQAAIEVDGLERETRAMAATELAALRTDQDRLTRIEHEAVPLAEAALHLGVSGYRAGSVGVADALGTVTAYQAALLQVIRLKAAVGRSRAALERLVGNDPGTSGEKEHSHEGH